VNTLKKKNLTLAIVGITATAILTGCSSDTGKNPVDGMSEKEHQQMVEERLVEDANVDDVKASIKSMHDTMNGLVCYFKQYRMAGTDEAHYDASSINKHIEKVLPQVTDTNVKKDLLMLRWLITYYATYDHLNNEVTDEVANTGVWAHRIAHDLDYTLHKGGEGDYFGATFALEGEKSKAWKFIQSTDLVTEDELFSELSE